MNSSAISIRGLRVIRGGKPALRDVTFDVRQGVITGLLGPSGSGKSTLMRVIVGVQLVEAGDVSVLGAPAGAEALRSRIGYMTQAPSVYGDLTVRENLAYYARIFRSSRQRVDEVIERVQLGPERDQVVDTLSGGQRARVSLASALIHAPPLLVLDEPTVGLDPVLRRDLWEFFRELVTGGATLLVSSHVMDEAARCDELVLLREGRVLAADSPASLRERTGEQELDGAFLRLVDEELAR